MDDTFSAADFTPTESSDAPVAEATAPVDSAQPDAATTPPAETTESVSTEPAKTGPIPFDVHKTALENARTKAVEEWKQRYGWAEQVSQQEFQQIAQMAQKASADPIAYLQDFIKDLQTHPTYGAQLKSLAAKALSQRSQGPDMTPLQVQMEDGRTVPLYSADQIAALKSQWLSEAKQEFQPFTQTLEQLQTEKAAAAQERAVAQYVQTTHADVATWPGMEDKASQVKVAEYLSRMDIDDDPRAVTLALNEAYRKVILPTLQQAERRTVLSNIHQQANANTVNPAHTSTRAPKTLDEMSTREALEYYASQQG
jgi:hypothetical protein